jgi:vacuolar-type H+-ATPase subunit H
MNEATRALEEIRRTELETAQHVEMARARASEIEADARAEGHRIVDEGRERGRTTARRLLEKTLEETKRVAETIRAQSESEARKLGEDAGESMGLLIEEMVGVVLEPPSEPGK